MPLPTAAYIFALPEMPTSPPLASAIRLASVLTATTFATVFLALPGAAADDVAGEQTRYQNKYGGCRSADAGRIAPRHRNVVGRKIASVPGCDYSQAIKKLGGLWMPAQLDASLSGTQK